MTIIVFNSGSGNWTVPAGVTSVQIDLWGGGGGGGGGGEAGSGQGASGGGGGGYCQKILTVTPGGTIAYVVGAGGTKGVTGDPGTVGTAGGTSTVSGGTYTANGGDGGINLSTSTTAGGTASGGSTNTTGGTGAGRSGNIGGTGGSSPNGGTGGITNIDGDAPGGGGGGGSKTFDGGNGASGRVSFTYTEAPVGLNYTGSGTLILSGIILIKNNHNYASSGSLILGGTSFANIPNNLNYTSSGSLILSGTSFTNMSNNHNYTSSGSLILGDTSFANMSNNLNYTSSGSLILDSNLLFKINYNYNTSGGLFCSGTAMYNLVDHLVSSEVKLDLYFSSLVNYSFIFELNSSWDIDKILEYDLDFTWDMGNQNLYWYTVEGICKVNSGCHTTGIPAGSTGRIYSRTVAARNLIDLCFKLNSLSLNYPIDWPVTKILRYKKPVYLDSVNYTDDFNTYNLLENNTIIKSTNNSLETYINDDVINTLEYFDQYTIVLPDYRKIVKHFKDGILVKVEIVEIDGLVKTYNQNAIATITSVPSSLISINYKIAKQLNNLSINDNSGVLQEYCHIPECLSLCINEDLMIDIGCITSFTDGFYDYVASGNINLTGRFIYDNANNIKSSGGLILGGNSICLINSYNYVSLGSLILGSSPLIKSAVWRYYTLGDALLLSGRSICLGKNLHYVSHGSLLLSSNFIDKLSFKFLIKNPKLILSINSTYSFVKNFKYNFNGSLKLNSIFTFNSNAYSFSSNSGLFLSGEFLVKSNRRNYEMNSGLVISDIGSLGQLLTLGYGNFGSINSIILAGLSTHETSLNINFNLLNLRFIPTGSIILSSNSNAFLNLHCIANGGVFIGSSALITSTNFNYVSNGSLIISGTSDTNIINDLDLIVNIGSQSNLITYEPILPETYGDNLNSFTFENGFVANSNCGCNPVPVTLFLSNNITTSSLLKLFLKRNNLNFSNDIELHYSIVGKSWRHNAHFTSIDKLENWDIIYEWSCDNLDSLNVWNFSILISRRMNNQTKITKLSFLFDQSDPCNNESIDFSFSFNTNSNNIVYPKGLNLLKLIVKDDIGFFKDQQWQNSSLLNIKITENKNIITYSKKDIFSIFP